MSDNFLSLEEYKAEVRRISQKYPKPTKEMVEEAVEFICPKQDRLLILESKEYLDNSWLQRNFVQMLYDKCCVRQEFELSEIWNKHAPAMMKANNHFFCCTVALRKPGEPYSYY